MALLSLYFSLTLSTKGSLDLCGSSNRLAMSTLGLPGRGRRNQEKPTSRCSPSRALYVCDPSMFLCVQPQRHYYPVRGPLRARAATASRCTACMPYPAATWLPARLPAACHQCLFFFSFLFSFRVGAMRRRCSAARFRPHRAIALCSPPPPARRSDVLRSYSIFLGTAADRSQAARVLAGRV